MNSMSFLISTVFDLYIMVVILRIWLQAARADFYNPFSQFIVKATQPVVAPLRRVIPSVGSVDLATVLFAYVLCVLKFVAMILIASGGAVSFSIDFLFLGLLSLIKAAGGLLFWVLLLRAILSWVSQGRSPIEYVFHQLTEPMLAPIRRILPPMGGFDLSVLVLFIVLQFANFLMGDIIGPIWYQL
ncbi:MULTISPECIES: YggT family protein [Vibrio]|uniref:YggT family protein n=1 Tax=Vibrio diazotrophicus TaxID=685 RepID=A0A2J8FVF6_VIBDI|nr:MULTISPECIES: YggT family protein [Vibrio]MCF7364275.1 YggT family protein [Vibrio sp. A1-b2]MCZ4374218.1 YggT family protein [Vibrio diazotrophicus]PNH77750.1 YggT family protein [Vibrio diazotrophicus]PNH87866.1 YggT family protein [Vibrio diazotrophicus]PNH96755.1 YggT family protein [Vibrio diazotrophicus]